MTYTKNKKIKSIYDDFKIIGGFDYSLIQGIVLLMKKIDTMFVFTFLVDKGKH